MAANNRKVQAEQVRQMFAGVAGHYDLCNRLLSFRRDIYWRREMVRAMRFFQTRRYLDLACGTGDVALECARQHPDVAVTALDFVPEMVEAARKKIAAAGLEKRVSADVGDATALDLPESSFDSVGMAFGIRNIPDRLKALSEMRRLAVPGGRIVILELVMPSAPVVRTIYRLMLNSVLPAAAALFSGNREAYHYLGQSILAFPGDAEFRALMEDAGIRDVTSRPLTFGVCRIFSGRK